MLTPNAAGKLDIVVRGDLAALLQVAGPKEQRERVQMVAGARNHLNLEFAWAAA